MISVPTGHRFYSPGAVIQVVQTVKTDTFSASSSSWVDVTGLSATITPTSLTSKILISVNIVAVNPSTTGSGARILRNTTPIGVADAAGSRIVASSAEFYGYTRSDCSLSYPITYLDSPSTTSATTYKIQVNPNAYTCYVNRSTTDGDSVGYLRGVSSITLTEIGA